MRQRWIAFAAAWTACSPAAGQTIDKAINATGVAASAFEKIDFSLVASLDPSIGKPAPLDWDDQALEESEYSITLKAERVVGGASIKTLVGGSISPIMRDASKDTSKVFGQFGVETTDTLTRAMRNGRDIEGQDTLIGYVRYRYEEPYADFFGKDGYATHRISLGADYKNYVAVWCDLGRQERRETTGCTGTGSVGFVISPSVGWVFSRDPLKEKFAPKLQGQFLYPTASGVDFVFELVGEVGRFSRPALGGTDNRHDEAIKAKIGVDLSRMLRRRIEMPKAFSFSVGVQWRRNWSNAADQSYERVFAMPSFSVTF